LPPVARVCNSNLKLKRVACQTGDFLQQKDARRADFYHSVESVRGSELFLKHFPSRCPQARLENSPFFRVAISKANADKILTGYSHKGVPLESISSAFKHFEAGIEAGRF
jgi:calcineurin-like phosphoesterase family protein